MLAVQLKAGDDPDEPCEADEEDGGTAQSPRPGGLCLQSQVVHGGTFCTGQFAGRWADDAREDLDLDKRDGSHHMCQMARCAYQLFLHQQRRGPTL